MVDTLENFDGLERLMVIAVGLTTGSAAPIISRISSMRPHTQCPTSPIPYSAFPPTDPLPHRAQPNCSKQ